MFSTRGHGASSQDLQERIAAVTRRLSQRVPVPSLLAKQTWLLPAYSQPALPKPVTTAALSKRGRVGCRNKHLPACSLGQGQPRQSGCCLSSLGREAGEQRWQHPCLLPSAARACSPFPCPHRLWDYLHITCFSLPLPKMSTHLPGIFVSC